jgi:hypothetical protein
MTLKKTNFGYEIRTNYFLYFFGGQESQILNLRTQYPEFDLIRVKQTHSEILVESKDPRLDYQIEADSHFTFEKNTALCIATADCVPILLTHQKTGLIAAVHAGWRGVANKILMKTVKQLHHLGADAHELDVWIGPHIQQNSFQVDQDVHDQILASLDSNLSEKSRTDLNYEEKNYKGLSQQISEGKYLVDLNQVTKNQLELVGVNLERVFDLHVDTYSSLEFHSHRRDKEKAGRQISFISRIF